MGRGLLLSLGRMRRFEGAVGGTAVAVAVLSCVLVCLGLCM